MLSCYDGDVIRSFRDAGTEDVFNGTDSPRARRACPRQLWPVARRKLDLLDAAGHLDDLGITPGLRLEALRGDRRGQFSVRVNRQYRICFRWTSLGPDEVEIIDYHD